MAFLTVILYVFFRVFFIHINKAKNKKYVCLGLDGNFF